VKSLSEKKKVTGFSQLLTTSFSHSAAIFFILSLLLMVSGCGSNEESSSSQKSVTITFWNTMDKPESELMPEIVSEFESENPSIKVSIKEISFYKAREKFEQSVKAGVAPDMLRTDRFWLHDFVKADLIQSIEKNELAEEYDDLLPIAKQVIEINKKLWAIPMSVDCLALFYNKQHFKDSGITPPKDFEEFSRAAAKLTDTRTGRYGFFIHPNGWYFQPILFSFGGRYFTPEGKVAINSDQSIKALEYLLHLKNRLKAVPPVSLRANTYKMMVNSFKSGQVSMIFNGPWAIREIISGNAFKSDVSNLGIVGIPGGPLGSFPPIGCQTLTISKTSKYKKEALKFAKFLCSKSVQTRLSKKNYGLPARKSIFSDPEIKKDPFLKTFVWELQSSQKMDIQAKRGKVYASIGEKIKKVLNGELTPEYAIHDLEKEWEALKD
jgi:arabinogalactan oligomer/maltooligosaccharide transport system substrate-binding protein